MVNAAITRATTTAMTNPRLREARRRIHALRRLIGRLPAVVHYFHDPADPYSYLSAQMLPRICDRYHIELTPHLVPPPDAEAAPEAARLAAWSVRDAAVLARAYGLEFPADAAPADPDLARHLSAVPTRAIARGDSSHSRSPRGGSWAADPAERLRVAALPAAAAADAAASLRRGAALRRKLGHYLGATFYFEGECTGG